MIEEIVCPDCKRIFYDWADADEHVCRPTKTDSEPTLSLCEMEPDRDRVLFTAGPEVAQAAIAQVTSCEACNDDAEAV
jgi:hypothetical protein